jgi:hypothetical protein
MLLLLINIHRRFGGYQYQANTVPLCWTMHLKLVETSDLRPNLQQAAAAAAQRELKFEQVNTKGSPSVAMGSPEPTN